jgi:hypothetical protein
MKDKAIKYLIGFGMFALYYVAMRVIENKVPLVRKLTQPSA